MKKIYFTLLSFLITGIAIAQTELLNETLRSGPLPTGWTESNTTFQTASGGYLRFENINSTLTTLAFDASAHTSIEIDFEVAKFGSGGDGPLTIEYSIDNGANWLSGGVSSTPTSSTYQSNSIPIAAASSTMLVRFSRPTSLSRKRFRDLIINGIGTASTNDTDTEAYDSGSQPAATTILSTVDTAIEAVEILDIELEDLGTLDGLDTEVTKIRLYPHTTNTADWTDNIQGVTVSDGTSIPVSSVTIDDAFIDINFTSGDLTVADGTITSLIISVYLNTSNITDGGVLSFAVDADNNGFEADLAGSTFASDFLLGDFNSNDFTIDVDVTELRFIQEPTNTAFNIAMAPSVTVAGTDENGNIDTNYNLDIDITSSGTLDVSPQTATATAGIATFSAITHTTAGTGLILTASDGLTTDATSTPFDITTAVTIVFQSFGIDGGDWNYATDPVAFIDADTWDVVDATFRTFDAVPSDGTQFFGVNDLNGPSGTTDFGEIQFEAIEIDTYEGVEISFEYEVDGYDGGDRVRYELFEDGVSLGIQDLVTGASGGVDQGGTLTLMVTDGVDEISLVIYVRQNGNDDYAGFDNFKVTGTLRTVVDYTYNDTMGGWTPMNPSGVSNSIDNINIVAGDANSSGDLIDSNTIANNLTISSGAKLVIAQNAGIKLSGTFTNDGDLTIRSNSTEYGSIIADNVVNNSNLIYRRYTNSYTGTGNNDLISAPFTGATFGDFAQYQQNELNLYANPTDASVRLFGPFDKSGDGEYLTYDEDVTADAAQILTPGTGYRAATDAASTSTSVGILVFEGDMATGTINVPVTISGINSPEWNVVGNPYPSYITLSEFLSVNSAAFDTSSAGVYGYDGDASDDWTIWNQVYADANPNALIAPGQGFAIASLTASETISFTPAMRSFGNTDDFITGRNTNETNTTHNISHLVITASTNTDSYSSDFYFTPNASQGLDSGYDASVFSDVAPQFAIYSHLVQNNTGIDMRIQSLSDLDLTNVTIPLGVNANQGEQLTFSISETDLPSTVEVYLDDTFTSTSTLLNSSDYILTPNTNLNGTGRFYLRFTDSALSTTDNILDGLNVYTNNTDKTIVITGQLIESTTAKIYDIQGRIVSTVDLETSKTTQVIDVNNLATGIYVVQLSNKSQNKSIKVILR